MELLFTAAVLKSSKIKPEPLGKGKKFPAVASINLFLILQRL